jgi:hypothetical protein
MASIQLALLWRQRRLRRHGIANVMALDRRPASMRAARLKRAKASLKDVAVWQRPISQSFCFRCNRSARITPSRRQC